MCCVFVFVLQHRTSYELRMMYWSSDLCSSDLVEPANAADLPAFEDLMLSKSSSESLCLNGSHGCGHLILQAVKISESRGKRLVGIAIRNVVGTFNPR